MSAPKGNQFHLTHGMSKTKTYSTWQSMIQRCESPNYTSYPYYGGRGIAVYAEWRASFVAFLAAVGPRPDGHTLDRIDGDGNYEPGNVRWATYREQNLNKKPKTHCLRGHPFNEKNTYLMPNGYRDCRTCRRAAKSASLARLKASL